MLEPQVIGKAYADLLISLGQGHQMGVKLRAGTAELNPKNFYGHGLHTEIRHLAMARIPPIDILRITMLVPATMVGADEQLGSLEVGKLADIVLLDENPLENIRNAVSMWRVMLEGHVFVSQAKLKAWGTAWSS